MVLRLRVDGTVGLSELPLVEKHASQTTQRHVCCLAVWEQSVLLISWVC